ncbi:MAG: copper resistance CopC family protein [Candidatus Limnocylindria bacterium]
MRLMRLATMLTALMLMALLLMAAVPMSALGHSGLAESTPADGSTLAQAPNEVRLVFSGELVPDGTGFTVVDEFGTVVGKGTLDLDVADRNEVNGPVTVEAPGPYTVRWSSTALDGHHEEGQLVFSFDLGSDAPSPDTALLPAATGHSTHVGMFFLLLALALGTRKIRGR